MTNIIAVRGDTQTYTLTFTDSVGAPLDLTGAAVTFSVKDRFAKTVGAGIVVSAPLTGVAVVTVDPEDTENEPDVRVAHRFDAQVVLSDGTVKTPIRGNFVVLPDVTI